MSSVAGPSRQPTKPPVVQPGSGNAIIVNPCQRLNPLLECIRNVNKEFGDIAPDFQLGRTTCALFLSLKYHRLHPEYIHQRIQKLGHLFNLRILLLMCDVSEHQEPIRELTKVCLINNLTIIVAWSNEEAGIYLATYKAFEHKPPDLIKERVDKEYGAMLRAALTSINKVNKTDVESLRTSFGSFSKIAHASPEQLRRLPGFGAVKVRRIVDAFDRPFRNKATSSLTQAQIRSASSFTKADERIAGQLAREDAVIENDSKSAKDREKEKERTTPKTRGVHGFGSAADMAPPPQSSSAREPSPVWDIELDFDAEEQDTDVDPLLAKKAQVPAEERNEEAETRGRRSASPVWDIELDLNEDEI